MKQKNENSSHSKFIDMAENAPHPKDNSYFNDVKDYGKTILKGSIEGISRLGKMMGPTQDYPKFKEGKLIPGRNAEQELEQQTKTLDELLPTEEGFVQSSLRRGLRMGPTMSAFPGVSQLSSAVRSGMAGFAGEGAKEAGFGEIGQTAAELTAFMGPDLARRLISSGNDAQIIDFARRFGMTDEQITPLLQSEFKQRWLSRLSSKGESAQGRIEDTRQGINRIYQTLEHSPAAGLEISEAQNGRLINGVQSILNDLPRNISGQIEGDLADLLNNPITGNTLMNFWRDVNSRYNLNRQQLQRLKSPIRQAINSISPELGRDFEQMNNLYSRFFPIARRLRPSQYADAITQAEIYGGIGSVFAAMLGSPGALYGLIGKKAVNLISQEMLLNPRFQQLARKTVESMNENRFGMVKKLVDLFKHEVGKVSRESEKKLNEISDEEIREMFSNQ